MLAVKRGEVPREEVSAEIGRLETGVRRLLDDGRTALPELAGYDRITAWAIEAQRRY